jgi:hypothetical protein
MLFAQPGFTHCYYDDLQSFFFVLLWLCLSRSAYQAVFDGWGSATHSPNEAGKLKWGDIQVEALFAPLIEKFDSRWGHAVRAVNGARVPGRGAGPADPDPPRRAPTTPSATPAQSQPASSRPGLPRRAPTSRASAASPRSQLYMRSRRLPFRSERHCGRT